MRAQLISLRSRVRATDRTARPPTTDIRRTLAVAAVVSVLCSSCWTELATKSYPQHPAVVAAVERWREPVQDALVAEGVDLKPNLDVALVVMACESKGGLGHPNLYQITRETWRTVMPGRLAANRNEPQTNIEAMAKLVRSRGWQPWEGGTLPDGTVWGSGQRGHRCWRWPA